MPLRRDSSSGLPDVASAPFIQFRNTSKRFGEFYANRDICLDIGRGEIHAIVGENGAGKTTLMNVLFGRLRLDSGSLILRGIPVSFGSPREAVRAGIGMVHQDVLCFPQLSVLENIILGREDAWPSFLKGILRTGPAKKEIHGIQDSLGFHLELNRLAKELSFASRQQIELVRILYRKAEILILDEPTSLLSPDETEKFLDQIKSIRAGGRTVLFISHRLVEVFAVADRITVLRGGRLAATLNSGATDIEEIARLMMADAEPGQAEIAEPDRCAGPVPRHPPLETEPAGWAERALGGRSSTHEPPRKSTGGPVGAGLAREKRELPPAGAGGRRQFSFSADAPVLELRNLGTGPIGTEPALRDISISIGKGEIFGIGGIVGNGQRSLARIIAGKTRPDSGGVTFLGEEISRTDLKERLKKNIRWLPENPTEEALLQERPLWENFLIGRFEWKKEFTRAGFICKQKVLRFSTKLVSLEDIAARDPLEPLSSLSGGNRQKVALARVLAGSPLLAILEQPCRGLDLRATKAVHDRVLELSRSRAVSFILISYDFDELICLCDRIAVIYRGEIMGMAESENLSREILGRWAVGVNERQGR